MDLGFVRDEPDVLRAALRRGLQADVLLVSGGVSKGDLDLVPDALRGNAMARSSIPASAGVRSGIVVSPAVFCPRSVRRNVPAESSLARSHRATA